jgi:hypothetical protein
VQRVAHANRRGFVEGATTAPNARDGSYQTADVSELTKSAKPGEILVSDRARALLGSALLNFDETRTLTLELGGTIVKGSRLGWKESEVQCPRCSRPIPSFTSRCESCSYAPAEDAASATAAHAFRSCDYFAADGNKQPGNRTQLAAIGNFQHTRCRDGDISCRRVLVAFEKPD